MVYSTEYCCYPLNGKVQFGDSKTIKVMPVFMEIKVLADI